MTYFKDGLLIQLQHGWEKNLDINLYGVSRGCFMAIERMGRSNGGRGGRIVNVASVAGFTVILQKSLKNCLQ